MAEVIDDTIITLLCQQQSVPILIPNVSIAEIIDTRGLDDNQNIKGVCRHVNWRNQNIPLVSLDALMNTSEESLPRDAKIIVMHALSPQSVSKFYGLIVTATPKMVKVTTRDIQPLEEDAPNGIKVLAILDEQKVAIPDLSFIEGMLIEGCSD